ncbi:hypothetical protein PINS_up005277 [Pythium insidiosum]|nr:hypothetical protein PINS_up005277 [Pythium insidiosum]
MEVELVVCSSAGKPILHYHRQSGARRFQSVETGDGAPNGGASHSFVSSLQGLLAFVQCVQQDELRELELEGCRCSFRMVENILSYVAIVRSDSDNCVAPTTPTVLPSRGRKCLHRLLRLLHAQILLVLSDRGLDVLRRQPSYDLRELLIGTERSVCGLADRWEREATFRFADCGVQFIRLLADERMEVLQTLEYEPRETPEAEAMVCGLLLARDRVVAVCQPRRKQFSILVNGELSQSIQHVLVIAMHSITVFSLTHTLCSQIFFSSSTLSSRRRRFGRRRPGRQCACLISTPGERAPVLVSLTQITQL